MQRATAAHAAGGACPNNGGAAAGGVGSRAKLAVAPWWRRSPFSCCLKPAVTDGSSSSTSSSSAAAPSVGCQAGPDLHERLMAARRRAEAKAKTSKAQHAAQLQRAKAGRMLAACCEREAALKAHAKVRGRICVGGTGRRGRGDRLVGTRCLADKTPRSAACPLAIGCHTITHARRSSRRARATSTASARCVVGGEGYRCWSVAPGRPAIRGQEGKGNA